jgi:hypothetical protein
MAGGGGAPRGQPADTLTGERAGWHLTGAQIQYWYLVQSSTSRAKGRCLTPTLSRAFRGVL